MKEENRKLTKQMPYVPTKTELRLLETLLNPASRLKSVTDICKEARISRVTYYALFKRPDFCKLYRESAVDMILQAIAPMVHALLREAKRGNAQHLKMALEIAGVYVEKREVTTETYSERIKRIRAQSGKYKPLSISEHPAGGK